MALFGESPVLMGAVGFDGRDYVKSLSAMGVNTKQIIYSTKPTSTFTVMTDSDDNQVGGFYPGAMEENRSIQLRSYENKSTFIVISANDPRAMDTLVAQAKKYHIPYLYDVSQQVSNISPKQILDGIEESDIVIVNDYEREVIHRKTKLEDKNMPNMTPIWITTYGKEGSIIEGRDVSKKIIIPSVKPNKVLDPTGAGDAYRAGFLYGYRMGYNLKQSGQIGSTAASFAVEKHGTQTHHFTLNQFNQKLKHHFDFTI